MLFCFIIKYWDECLEKEAISKGFTMGKHYSDAVDKITHFYGEDNTLSLKIEYISDDDVLLLPDDIDDDIFNSIRETNRW